MVFLNLLRCFKERLLTCCCLLYGLPGIAQTVENERIDFDQSKQVMLIHFDL